MVAKMRTIEDAISEIKKADPQTKFTKTALRRMVKNGVIPAITIGRKFLVNLDKLFEYLNYGEINHKESKEAAKQPVKILKINGIRPVQENFTIKETTKWKK